MRITWEQIKFCSETRKQANILQVVEVSRGVVHEPQVDWLNSTVTSLVRSSSCVTCWVLHLCNSPIGTNGFSLVFLINLSLKVSSLDFGKGLKPSITGGWEKSNGTGADDGILGVCGATAGVVASAMSTLNCNTNRNWRTAHPVSR